MGGVNKILLGWPGPSVYIYYVYLQIKYNIVDVRPARRALNKQFSIENWILT